MWPFKKRAAPVSAECEAIRDRIRAGEPVSLAEGLLAIGATPADIAAIHIPKASTPEGAR